LIVRVVEAPLLQRIYGEVQESAIPWQEEYSEYQSAGWLTAALLNDTGRASDTIVRDCVPRSTDLLETLPSVGKFIRSLGVEVFCARLALLKPNSFLWEHVDYGEVARTNVARLHLPIRTNPDSSLVFARSRVHLQAGYLWMVNPRQVHGAANLGHTARLHLILDCNIGDSLNGRAPGPLSESEPFQSLPEPSPACLSSTFEQAMVLADLGYFRTAEHSILRLFHDYALPPGYTLETLVRLYDRLPDRERAFAWQAKRNLFLGGGCP
jgi:hypothetical protein